jgi:hypothetical protein
MAAHEPRVGHAPIDGEGAKVEVRFMPGCLVLSIVLSVVATILLNVVIRLFN